MPACPTAAGSVRPCRRPRLQVAPCRFACTGGRGLDLENLVRSRTINAAMKDLLLDAVERGDNLLVSGATNSGKTTLLNALVLRYSAA